MEETINPEVETVHEDLEAPQIDQPMGDQQAQPEQTGQPKANPNSENIRRLREKAARVDELEQQHEELVRKMKGMKAPIETAKEEDDDYVIRPDDLVEGRHLAARDRQYKELQAEIKSMKQQSIQSSTEARLRNRYPDIDSVATLENIEKLRDLDPEFAAMMHSSSDFYNKGVSVYKRIKELGIVADKEHAPARDHAQENSVKPRPLSSVSPLANANAFSTGNLDDAGKAALWKQMQEIRRNR